MGRHRLLVFPTSMSYGHARPDSSREPQWKLKRARGFQDDHHREHLTEGQLSLSVWLFRVLSELLVMVTHTFRDWYMKPTKTPVMACLYELGLWLGKALICF